MAGLQIGRHTFEPDAFAVMAIVNSTPDSFYDAGATYGHHAALERVTEVVQQGADLVDIGGVKAGHGVEVSAAEELRRTVDLVAEVRHQFPTLAISVDTWRSEVARQLCEAGADLINDTWAGHDPALVEVAATYHVGLVCSHSGGLPPRTDPHRVGYADPVVDVISTVTALAKRAVASGVDPNRIVIDPTHDFGKNTWHSLSLTHRLNELVNTGWPVLVALSRKDFIGETLNLPVTNRLPGTLAATAISAWHGARVFRAHDVAETRQVLDMVASIRGTRPPAVARRGLA